MKKVILFVSVLLLLFANTAMAASIAGMVGITAKGGASYIVNSEFSDEVLAENPGLNKDLKADLGYAVGDEIVYGINDNLAVNFDVIYSQADIKGGGISYSTPIEIMAGRGKTVDFALGAQWRFLPQTMFIPYVEAGFDVLLNYFDSSTLINNIMESGSTELHTDVTYGGHLSIGSDFFFNRHVALNAEIRGLLSSQGDVKTSDGFAVAHYDPSNISAFLGIKVFFPLTKHTDTQEIKTIRQ